MKQTTAQIHQAIADKVIDSMKTLGSSWSKSWSTPSGLMPTSMSTNKPYNGINLLILGLTRATENYSSNEWATYNQWSKRNAQVIKGEKATTVIFFKPLIIKDKADGEEKTIPLMRTFSVFNACQVSGYESAATVTIDPNTQPVTLADDFAASVGADVRHSDVTSAFYVPSKDFINVPFATQFGSEEAYATTLLHELTHWSGAKSRCNRNLLNTFGTKDYAKEELVAELGAAMLAGSLAVSMVPRDDHAKYLNSWIKRLGEDPSIIFSAAAKASQAARWLTDTSEPAAIAA